MPGGGRDAGEPAGGDLRAGDVVGRYRIEARLGDGATGVVYRAAREPDGLLVALKVLRAELGADQTYRRRFDHEARAAAEVRNRYLVRLLEAG